MSQKKFPWDKPHKQAAKGVTKFINNFKPYLKENQIELLEHFKGKISGFHLQSHVQFERPSMISRRLNHEAVFSFENDGIKGEVTVFF